MQSSPFSLRGSPAAAPYGPKSLAESGKPPATAVAGDEISFQVQQRYHIRYRIMSINMSYNVI